jgi:hypothetical protein
MNREEAAIAGRAFADLKAYVPPCSYEAATYGSRGYPIVHNDPVEGRGLPPCPDRVEPYSTFTTPYRWMREENFADICQAEGLNIRASASGKTHGWATEDDRQRALLKALARRCPSGPPCRPWPAAWCCSAARGRCAVGRAFSASLGSQSHSEKAM